jgi:uroporphyrinogen-III synthase
VLPSLFTTHEVLAELRNTPLRGKKVVVQRYGETNRELKCALEREGAQVTEIVDLSLVFA